MTIPTDLLNPAPPNGAYNAAWLSPAGEFQFAERGHSSHKSEAADGYGHLDIGWVRITCSPHINEVGCQMRSGNEATDEQVEAVWQLVQAVGALYLFGDRHSVPEPGSVADVRKALEPYDHA